MQRPFATLILLLTVALGAFAQNTGVVGNYDAEQGRTFVPNPPAVGPFPACDTVVNYGTIPAYPAGVFGHGSATLGDTLYMVGGTSTGAASNVFARYHIPSGTWAPADVFPESKTGGDLVKCGNALFYIGGGSALTTPTATCYRYTPAGGWTPIANIPTPVTGHVSEAWGDSVIFTVGGGWTSYLTTVQVYRPASNTWSTSTPLPAGTGRRSFAGGLEGNRIFVAAGYSGSFRKDFRIGTIVRADSIFWASGPDVPMRPTATGSSRPGGHAVGGRFYFITGETTPAPTTQDSIFIWDITSSAWQPTPVTGRGTLAASNYWSVVSSSNIGGQLMIWFPGGALGTALPGLMALRTCPTVAPPDTGWRVQTSGVTTALYAVKAVTREIAWAGGAGGAVIRTTNNGATWTRVGTLGADIYGIAALDENTAFVITAPASTYIIRTTNGGGRWDTVFTQASPGFLDGIAMVDATNGWAMGDPVGGKWTVLRTTNGGASWARIATEPNQVGSEAGWNNSFEVLGSNLWFGTNSSKVYRSTDNGATWTGVAAASTNTYDLGFGSLQYGAAAGTGGLITTNGGASWSASTIPGSGNINGVAASSISEYWAVRAGSVYRTSNLGGSWAASYTGTGTYYHVDFWSGGGYTRGWAVNSAGTVVAFYGPTTAMLPNDIGVASLQRGTPSALDAPAPSPGETAGATFADVAPPPDGVITLGPPAEVPFGTMADTVRFRALVRNYGSTQQNSYQVRWSVDGVVQGTVSNTDPLEVADVDTITFQWNNAATGPHTARAWTILATDANPANDSAALAFTVGRAPGDTLYTFIVPGQQILGVAKMGPSNKLALTSGGQSSTLTTDNKWIVTTMGGTILDTTRMQINPTTGQGFGFRDLAWDGRWLLTSDNAQVRRIDTTTLTEIATRITGPGTLQRGLAADGRNRIWKSNFTTDPVAVFDSTGATIRTYGVPTVAPYGIALDKWTSRGRMWLWYTEPSLTGQYRLSKVDTATGAIVRTFDYSTMFPTTGSIGGLDIINDHPSYPGRVVALMVIQNFPNSIVVAVELGPDSLLTGVDEGRTSELPDAFALDQNYPNPFNPSTVIRYALPKESRVTLKVYDILGREVAALVDDIRPAGYHEAVWNSRSTTGAAVATGLYFYRLEAKAADGTDAFTTVKKMLLVK